MTELLAALIVFVIAIVGMAIGVIVSNRRLKGSCGGLANLRDEHGEITCAICGDPSESCKGEDDGRSRAVESGAVENATAEG